MSLPAGDLDLIAESPAGELPGGPKAIEGRSLGAIAWTRLKRDKVAMAGGVVVILLILVAFFGPEINSWYGQGPNTFHDELTDINTQMPIGKFGGMSLKHWFGVEPVNGRDLFARVIQGARTSLVIASLATALSLAVGVTLGLIAGYFGGFIDSLIARTMDTLLSFPSVLFSIALLGVFTNVTSFWGLSGNALRFALIIFVLGFFGWPYIGRIVRGQVLSIREKEFIEAARSIGASNTRIITKEILPNLVGPILVYTTLIIPTNILGEAGLSFLGVGVQPPLASWGQMISTASNVLQVDPTFIFWPGMAIFVTVLAFNLFGDGLRDALDPKSTR